MDYVVLAQSRDYAAVLQAQDALTLGRTQLQDADPNRRTWTIDSLKAARRWWRLEARDLELDGRAEVVEIDAILKELTRDN
ncbi:MAG: hypothetical protein HYX52_05580 [Chloroflexi bacterium]|nr:hypothetical protein [Chloroflexota bacterium]